MNITTYTPNWNDPRVQKRVAHVLGWCEFHLSPRKSRPVHHDKLRDIFGVPSNPLARYLRANLLCQVGAYRPGKSSFSYLLREEGVAKLRAHGQHMVTTSSAAPLHPDLASLEFRYALKSDRYFHPLQQIESSKKPAFWARYLPFDYDIEACAPTVLFQLARRAGLSEIVLSNLHAYLDDKSAVRQHVVDLTGLSLKDAKRLVNSLFNGARLAKNSFCAAFRMLGYDAAAMDRLQQSPEIRRLRRDIKRVWDRLELIERQKQQPSFEQVLDGTAQPFTRKLKTGSQKWCFYFSQERQIMEAIVGALRRDGIKHFTEHDGFRAESPVDVAMLQAEVLARTGFSVKLRNASWSEA